MTLFLAFVCGGCSTLPDPKHKWAKFPENAYIGKPVRPFTVIGSVRAKENFTTLDPSFEENQLCNNYFNVASKKLVEFGKAKGADAVIDIKSVVFLLDGKTETYPRAECSDDGGEGQILLVGTAVKWKPTAAGQSTGRVLDDPWNDLNPRGARPTSDPAPTETPSPEQPRPGDPRGRIKHN